MLITTVTVCIRPWVFFENLLGFPLPFKSAGFVPRYRDSGAKLGQAGQSNVTTAQTRHEQERNVR